MPSLEPKMQPFDVTMKELLLRTTTLERRLTSKRAATQTFQFRSVTLRSALRSAKTPFSLSDVMLKVSEYHQPKTETTTVIC